MKLSAGIVCFLFAVLTLNAQSPDPVEQALHDQAEADRDSFGTGPSHSPLPTLEERSINTQSDLVYLLQEMSWTYPEESDLSLAGTTKGADAFLARSLAYSDAVVIGTIGRQTSIFNSTKRDIVTVSLLTISDVIYSKSGLDLTPGNGIYIARSGGTVIVSRHKVQIVNRTFPEFSTGSQYLLFLTLDSKTHSYRVRELHALLIQGDTITPIDTIESYPAQAYLSSTNAFLEALRNQIRELTQ